MSAPEEDLRFINANFPNVTIAFHDANFGVRFDETLSVLEKVNNRTRYGVGLTMSVLSNRASPAVTRYWLPLCAMWH